MVKRGCPTLLILPLQENRLSPSFPSRSGVRLFGYRSVHPQTEPSRGPFVQPPSPPLSSPLSLISVPSHFSLLR